MTEPAPILRFDRFTFHPASGELHGEGGDLVRLEPQPAKVLALLAGRAGQLVTREELQREVWPDGTFVDFERGLNYCIAKIRAALGDSAAEPRFVETLPRRGYRFLAVVVAGEGKDQKDSRDGKDKKDKGQPVVRGTAIPPTVIFAMVVALLTAFGVTAWLARDKAPDSPTIAVARFDNETGRGNLDREAQVLTDSIVEALTHPPGRWSVIGNAAILRTPRTFRDLGAIRSALDADLIVLGQLQESDGQLRVLVHLIRAGDQKHLWANRYPLDGSGWREVEGKVVRTLRAAVVENVAAGIR
ncbi:MAG TPA: winged helix-turn-helix domain-containing protein [Thermoanaerobaculia bacterium]|jgi:DNA-binding winged helix-turn-helix (wHTH) protein/TolB-like protein|nr:winged helix-turn-helix domain-containing protein [Thermoanaerobaculia bacterium]